MKKDLRYFRSLGDQIQVFNDIEECRTNCRNQVREKGESHQSTTSHQHDQVLLLPPLTLPASLCWRDKTRISDQLFRKRNREQWVILSAPLAGMNSPHSSDHLEHGSGSGMNSPTRTISDESSSTKRIPAPPVRLPQGERFRYGTGALSAPPPGFGDGPEERTRNYQWPWLAPDDGPVVANEDAASGGWYKQPNQHTTSFTNLVAVLGTGLAESMDDATRDQRNSGDAGDFFDPELELSLARHSRHAASRLIGTVGTSPNRAVGSVTYRGSPPLSMPKATRRAATPEAGVTYPSSGPEAEQMSPSIERPFSVEEGLHRQSTPLGIFAQGGARAPPTKDIGVTVMEPGPLERNSAPPNLFEGILSHRPSQNPARAAQELERDMQALSMEDRSRRSPFSSTSPSVSEMIQHRAEIELQPFIWDVCGTEPSRALVILRASSLHIPDVRSTCEAFGVLDTFRSDFSDRGIIFVGYYDIRSAQYAALELEACLKRLAMSERGNSDIRVQYCVPLNSSSAHDGSILVISEIPPGVSEESLTSMLSSYGSIRSLHRQGESKYGASNYAVEFHNVQDAKQALMELESTQPWGPDVLIEEGSRSPAKRKRGRELLGLIGRWRQANPQGSRGTPSISASSSSGMPTVPLGKGSTPVPGGSSDSSSPMVTLPDAAPASYAHNVAPAPLRQDYAETRSARPQQQSAQLVVAPDGSYSYVMVNHAAYPPAQDHHGIDVSQAALAPQHILQAPHVSYLPSIPSSGSSHYSSGTSPPSHQHPVHYWPHGAPPPVSTHQYHPHLHGAPVDGHLAPSYLAASASSLPYYQHVVHTPADSSLSSGSTGFHPQQVVNSPRRAPLNNQVEDREARHLMLSIDAVESGRDTRTSLMVRNIPNKYTQQMLLSEFSENGHGPGKIDFFYLPIDFKNRCNRGYAFVNFVDYRDIVPFHRQYFGQHWKVFNSDKICDITYARIQGKAGMLKRFENSALMEKDDEYKPLVFVSHGADKGRRIPFP